MNNILSSFKKPEAFGSKTFIQNNGNIKGTLIDCQYN